MYRGVHVLLSSSCGHGFAKQERDRPLRDDFVIKVLLAQLHFGHLLRVADRAHNLIISMDEHKHTNTRLHVLIQIYINIYIEVHKLYL